MEAEITVKGYRPRGAKDHGHPPEPGDRHRMALPSEPLQGITSADTWIMGF